MILKSRLGIRESKVYVGPTISLLLFQFIFSLFSSSPDAAIHQAPWTWARHEAATPQPLLALLCSKLAAQNGSWKKHCHPPKRGLVSAFSGASARPGPRLCWRAPEGLARGRTCGSTTSPRRSNGSRPPGWWYRQADATITNVASNRQERR